MKNFKKKTVKSVQGLRYQSQDGTDSKEEGGNMKTEENSLTEILW